MHNNCPNDSRRPLKTQHKVVLSCEIYFLPAQRWKIVCTHTHTSIAMCLCVRVCTCIHVMSVIIKETWYSRVTYSNSISGTSSEASEAPARWVDGVVGRRLARGWFLAAAETSISFRAVCVRGRLRGEYGMSLYGYSWTGTQHTQAHTRTQKIDYKCEMEMKWQPYIKLNRWMGFVRFLCVYVCVG